MCLYYFIKNIFIFYICIYIILILIDCMIRQMLYTLHYTTDLFHICKIQWNIIKDEMRCYRWQKSLHTGRATCPSTTLSTTGASCTGARLKSGLQSQWQTDYSMNSSADRQDHEREKKKYIYIVNCNWVDTWWQ